MMEVKTGMGSLGIGSRSSFSPQESDLKGIHHAAGNLRIAVYAAEYQVKLVTLLQTTHLSLLSLQQNRVMRDDGPAVPTRPFQAAFQMHKTISEQRASSHKSVALERATTQLNIADSMLNQQVAKDSKDVAEAARRDSTAMKTTASLTMIYLPATFMTAISSTIFFNTDENGQLPMGRQIWIYVVASTILTTFTFLV
ncbi:hypothetical protein ABVK25_010888 [Lepraria finkii]|uniref:Uncharacterized protein n=1 Tax=Lepraria finkii TaxID=1340010 RepID=A0ABR4ASZ6_9LECA